MYGLRRLGVVAAENASDWPIGNWPQHGKLRHGEGPLAREVMQPVCWRMFVESL